MGKLIDLEGLARFKQKTDFLWKGESLFTIIGRVRKDNGDIVATSDYRCTDYLPITGKDIMLKDVYEGQSSTAAAAAYFYDSNKNPIGNVSPRSFSGTSGSYTISSQGILSGAAYIRLSADVSKIDTASINIDAIDISLVNNYKKIDECINGELVDFTPLNNTYVTSTGSESHSTSTYSATPFLSVKGGENITIECIERTSTPCACFYDFSKNFISSVLADNADDTFYSQTYKSVIAPSGACFIRVNGVNSWGKNFGVRRTTAKVLNLLNEKELSNEYSTEDGISITDSSNHDALIIKDGHIFTKEFNSKEEQKKHNDFKNEANAIYRHRFGKQNINDYLKCVTVIPNFSVPRNTSNKPNANYFRIRMPLIENCGENFCVVVDGFTETIVEEADFATDSEGNKLVNYGDYQDWNNSELYYLTYTKNGELIDSATFPTPNVTTKLGDNYKYHRAGGEIARDNLSGKIYLVIRYIYAEKYGGVDRGVMQVFETTGGKFDVNHPVATYDTGNDTKSYWGTPNMTKGLVTLDGTRLLIPNYTRVGTTRVSGYIELHPNNWEDAPITVQDAYNTADCNETCMYYNKAGDIVFNARGEGDFVNMRVSRVLKSGTDTSGVRHNLWDYYFGHQLRYTADCQESWDMCGGYIVRTACNSTMRARNRMSLYLSKDEGQSFDLIKELHSQGGYSSFFIEGSKIYVAFEILDSYPTNDVLVTVLSIEGKTVE